MLFYKICSISKKIEIENRPNNNTNNNFDSSMVWASPQTKKVGRSSPPPFFPPPSRYICAKAAKAMDGMRQASLAHGRLGHKGEAKRESPFCVHDRKSRVAIMYVL